MPVRSLNSCVLKWPDRPSVISALQNWATRLKAQNAEIIKIGFFGSYARDDWGVGSDIDIIMIVSSSNLPFEKRSAIIDTTALPIAADLLVYTENEWKKMKESGFYRKVMLEAEWLDYI
ncbi:MAG: nucleotidyltransferase domain-containing protein [Chitinivibrionales bacterium]|nr:nucleotidyltransferase domain-containing protein [Chitinivibrionales bacterium]